MTRRLPKKPRVLLSLLLLLSLAIAPSRSDKMYRLNKLKTFWQGRGVAIPYPDRILLTSSKLKNQIGFLSSMQTIELGSYFTIEMTIDYQITNKEGSNQQFVFGMTSGIVGGSQVVRDWERDLPMPVQYHGFLMLIDDFGVAHAGFINSSLVTKDEVKSSLKMCKMPGKGKNQVRLMLRLKQETLTLYFEDVKDGTLTKCVQMVDVALPGETYFILGASDDSGKAQIEIPVFDLTSPTDIDIVPNEEKVLGDEKLTYWSTDPGRSSFAREVASYKATSKYYYENSKVYTEELMSLADKSLKDVRLDLVRETNDYVERLKGANTVIGRESDQIEALGWILVQNKNQHKYKIDDILSMTMDLLEQLIDSIDDTDRQTKAVYDLITKLNVDNVAQELTDKVTAMIGPLKKLIFKAKYIAKEPGLDFLQNEDAMKDLVSTIQDFKKSVKDKIRQVKQKEASSTTNQSLFIMILVGAGIVAGLGWFFWRIKKAVDKAKGVSM